jgi:hypothetical protein
VEGLEDRVVPSNVPPAGITNWWTGDGSADDLIGGLNGALVGGATTGPGLVDQAFILNGNGAFVNIPNNAALNVGTANFTLSLWVNFNSTAGEQVLAEKRINTYRSTNTGWSLTTVQNNVLALTCDGIASEGVSIVSTGLSIPTHTWVHFAARRSGSTVTTFMNGEAVASGTFAGNLNSSTSLKFGHRGNLTDRPPGAVNTAKADLNGAIDEVQLYVGTGLTDTQIQGIFHDGPAGESKPMAVRGANPAADSIIATPPTDFSVHFSEAYAAASLQAGDFKVNGIAADSVTATGANDATFHFRTSPVTVQGLQTMRMAAGSVTAADTTLPASYQQLEAWTKSFRYDAVAIQVSSTSPVPGGTIVLANPTLQVHFNEAVDPNSVSTSNLNWRQEIGGVTYQGVTTGFTLSADHTSVTYALGGLSDGTVIVTIPAGTVTDAFGNPMLAGYSATYGVDVTTAPFPTPLAALNPAGSLVFQGSTTGVIDVASDTDTFTLAVDPGQTITVLLTPTSSSLQPTVQVLDPSTAVLGTATAAAVGQNALLQTIPAGTAGTYSIVVGAANSTVGHYTVQVTLNAQLDTASDGSTPVQSLDGGALDVEPGPVTINRAAAVGTVDKPVARVTTVTTYHDIFDLRGSWDPGSGANTWVLNCSGNSSSPLNLGVAGSLINPGGGGGFQRYAFYGRAGDVVTLRTCGSSSGGGTLATANLGLRGPNGAQQVSGTAVAGASSDYAISSLTLTTTGTYTVTVITPSNGSAGTYTLTASLVTPSNPRPNAADVYSFSATAGQYLSFVAATGDSIVRKPQVQLSLYAPGNDPITGTPVATSRLRGTLDGLLEYDPPTTGTYLIKVTTGPGLAAKSVSYSLVAVSNGSFEGRGANGSFATAQDITGRAGVLGAQRLLTTTLVGANSGGLSRPVGEVFGPDGNLYVASWGSDSVLRYNPSTGAFLGTFVSAGSGGLSNPTGLFFGADGKLYVVSQGNNSVLRYDGKTGAFLDTFVTSGSGGLSQAQRAAFGPDGNLYVSSGSYDTSSILRYNGSTGAFIDAFVSAGSGGLVRPHAFLFASDGNLYVASASTNQVLRYNATTGAFVDVFVSADSGGLYHPTDMTFGSDGNLYVCSVGNDRVLRYQGIAGAQPGAFIDAFVAPMDGGLTEPNGLLFDTSGSLCVTSFGGNKVLRRSVAPDFYKVTLSAGQTVTLSTSTPGEGAGEPVNLLDPHLELYDSTRTLVATGTVLADGRNETITFTAQTAGTYYVKVSRQNSAEGDYVLDPVECGGEPEKGLEPAKVSGTISGGGHHRKTFLTAFLATLGNGTALDAKYATDFEEPSDMKVHRGDGSAAIAKVLEDTERDWRPQAHSSRLIESTTANHRRPVSDATETLFAWW